MFKVPVMHMVGVRKTKKKFKNSVLDFKTHRWNDWRKDPVPDAEKVHLTDKAKVSVLHEINKYFIGEVEREGGAIPEY